MGSTAGPPDATYGFIGLGNMGFGMAKNVRQKIPSSSKMIVCELNKSARDEFCNTIEGTLETAESPKEIAEKCDIIISSLPNAKAVEIVYLDPSTGLLAGCSKDSKKLFLETSTIEATASLGVLKKVQEAVPSAEFLDAPVSGGIPPAHAGTLTFMVGGPEDVFEKAKPIMSTMGKAENLILCGGSGAGLATKQINNYIAYCSYVALCEGMNTGLKFGLDPKTLNNVINASSGQCWNSIHMNPVKGVCANSSASRDFKGGFKVELAQGVTRQMTKLMEEVGAKSMFGPVMDDIWARAVESPMCREQESRSIFRLFAEENGSSLGKVKVE
ncbi:uncharacterized protein LTR77_003731 [Saxophila tyrrhenica]|uniref:3-hydroxyisobutyrate dehydrogenase n=1 Tax=Saxophila tyrrhenica TaxID=1690608 RepID=A0AAV9PH41_9PEZI|nr:hypothetical protein LTR77_003731 [Saxophila tyrrhenica]